MDGSSERTSEHQPLAAGGPERAKRPVPRVVRRSTTRFGWRHVQGIATIRFLVAVWLVCLASIFLAFGYWWGAFLLLAAGLAGWLAYQMPRWKAALEDEGDAPGGS